MIFAPSSLKRLLIDGKFTEVSRYTQMPARRRPAGRTCGEDLHLGDSTCALLLSDVDPGPA
jgi:hypothetical protein